MATIVSKQITRAGRNVTITALRSDGSERVTHETATASADEWRACAEGAARDAVAQALTRESAARKGRLLGGKVARTYLGTLDGSAILAGVLAEMNDGDND